MNWPQLKKSWAYDLLSLIVGKEKTWKFIENHIMNRHRLKVLLSYSLLSRGSMQNRHEEIGINIIMEYRNIEWTNGMFMASDDGEILDVKRGIHLRVSVHKYVWVGFLGKSYSLHRVIAKAFVPNPENKPTVNHKDWNRFNNSAYNLEWCTHAENTQHYHNVLKNTGYEEIMRQREKPDKKQRKSVKSRCIPDFVPVELVKYLQSEYKPMQYFEISREYNQ